MRNTPFLLLAVAALGASTLTACAAHTPSTSSYREVDPQVHDRLAFVQAACGGCHAVEPPGLSPNPNSPTFEAIANREGLNEETLSSWLSDAHNYPEVMDFDLEPHHVEMIAQHMLTLRRTDYTPPPS